MKLYNWSYLHLPQNFCNEAVCYSEMMTRKIERNQLARDHKNFTVQVPPVARQSRGWAHDDVKTIREFLLVNTKAQQESTNVGTEIEQKCLAVMNCLYS